MPNKKELLALVNAHKGLGESMTGAIWIKTDASAAYLVEIIPDLPDDPSVSQPFVFSPTPDFRYSLHLFAANLRSLVKAVSQDINLAQDIVSGTILLDSPDAEELRNAASCALSSCALSTKA